MEETKVRDRLLDVRTRDRNLKDGLITEEDINSHLKALPDVEDNASWVLVDMEDAEISEEIQEDEVEVAVAAANEVREESPVATEESAPAVPTFGTPSDPNSNDPSSGNL